MNAVEKISNNLAGSQAGSQASAQEPECSVRRYLLGLGSNIEPEKHIPRAVQLLSQLLAVEATSTAWETPAVGTPGPDFINAAMIVQAECPPDQLKQDFIRKVEAHLGRVRGPNRNAPRTMDIDILLVDDSCNEPLLWQHAYLAVPAAELLPDLVCPETGERLDQIACRLAGQTVIRARPEVLVCEFRR